VSACLLRVDTQPQSGNGELAVKRGESKPAGWGLTGSQKQQRVLRGGEASAAAVAVAVGGRADMANK
jgi:hypothetical protein